MIKCKICGYESTPTFNKHYISRDNGTTGLVTAMKRDEEKIYDTFDCPACGCQIIAQERKRSFVEFGIAEKTNDEEEAYENE